LPKAKEVRSFAEKLITLARREENRLHARRLVARDIQNPAVVKKLFDTLGARFATRPGGYTQILHLGPRRGDGAEMAYIQLVGYEYKPAKDEKGAKKDEGKKGDEKKAEKPAEKKPAAKKGRTKATEPPGSRELACDNRRGTAWPSLSLLPVPCRRPAATRAPGQGPGFVGALPVVGVGGVPAGGAGRRSGSPAAVAGSRWPRPCRRRT